MVIQTKVPTVPTTLPLGPGALRHLAERRTGGDSVLSIYVDLDPRRFPTPASREIELRSLLDEARRHAPEPDVRVVQEWIESSHDALRGVHGLALFSCSGAGLFAQVRLPEAVDPLAVVDEIPWVEPLAARITPGSWAVAVLSRSSARLFRGGPAGLTEFAAYQDELHRRHAQGGWSQARFQRGIEAQVAAHVRRASERLTRAHRRERFAQLVIVCSNELRSVVEQVIPHELQRVMTGIVDADLEHASTARIVATIAPLVELIERERERQLIARLNQALATGGAAAAGLDEVLGSLEQGLVSALLIPEHSATEAWSCRVCGRLSAGGEGHCPLDSSLLEPVNATEHAIKRACAQDGEIVVVRWEREWLDQHGGIAALLRW